MKTVLAILSDLHINSTVAVSKPYFALDDGDSHKSSKIQNWLWWCLGDFTDRVMLAAHNAEVYTIFGGDLIEGDVKERTTQVMTRNMAIARALVTETTAPLRDISDRVFVIRGTGAHSDKSAAHEEELAHDWDAEKTPEGSASWWFWLGDIENIYIEVSHHTVMGKRASARAGAIGRLAEDTILEYGGKGQRVPRLVIRGHVHKYADSFDLYPACRAITLPAFCVAGEFAHRIGRGHEIADIGGVIATLENGRMNIDPVVYHPARQAAWTPPFQPNQN